MVAAVSGLPTIVVSGLLLREKLRLAQSAPAVYIPKTEKTN